MTNEEAKKIIKSRCYFTSILPDTKEALNMAIEALSEPTISLSVIEKIHDAIDNAESDGFLINENGHMLAMTLTKEHVNEIIDKAVKECTHE